MSISVALNGAVTVVVPRRVFLPLVPAFVARHSNWIEQKIAAARTRPALRLAHLDTRDYCSHKEAARDLVHKLVAHHNAYYGYSHGAIRIGNQKSRWGSCSTRGSLSFNYKILFLPPALQTYVVVHELCHLKEMNHSKRFWALVAEQVPEWSTLRNELRNF